MRFSGVNLDFESKSVPIYIACRGPRLFQLAGELADGVIIGSLTSSEGLNFALKNLRKGANRIGRDPEEIDVVFWSYMSMMDDEEMAKQLVKRIVVSSMWSSKSILKYIGVSDEIWSPIEKILRIGFEDGLSSDDIYKQAYEQLPDSLLDIWSITGNPERVSKRVKNILDAGVNHFACLFFGKTPKDIKIMQEQFAELIIPQFK
jgi:5,10-methylenetetrahydromethanopterin reductase